MIELGSEIKGRFKIEAFLRKWKHGMSEDEFKIWLSRQTPLTLLEFYVDHQEILEVSTKNSLNCIIDKKLEFEKKFLHFKNMQHNFFYWYSATALSFAIFLGMVGGVAVSAGLTSALFLSLAVSSLVIKLSFWLANYLLNSRHKGHSSGLLNFRIGFRQLKYEISNYWLKVKEKELTEKVRRIIWH